MNIIAVNKIRVQGAKGLGVTVPAKFVKQHSLQNGDDAEIYETLINGKYALVVIPTKQNTEQRLSA